MGFGGLFEVLGVRCQGLGVLGSGVGVSGSRILGLIGFWVWGQIFRSSHQDLRNI